MFPVGGYSNWNWPRFTNTDSSFSKLSAGNKPPNAVTFLHLTLSPHSYENATPKSFPFMEYLNSCLSASKVHPTMSPGWHTAPYSAPSSPFHFLPRAVSAHYIAMHTPTETPAVHVVSHAVLLLLVALLVLPAPAHLHQTLAHDVDLEVVTPRHHGDAAQTNRRESGRRVHNAVVLNRCAPTQQRYPL